MARTIYIPWDDDDVHIIYASLLKQLSTGKHVALFWHVIMILCQSIFCSFSLMQCAKRKRNKYQFYSLFFLPNQRLYQQSIALEPRTSPLYHWCCLFKVQAGTMVYIYDQLIFSLRKKINYGFSIPRIIYNL
jgi:hypothetical protein